MANLIKLLPWSTKFLILVTRHTLPSSYNITSMQGPRIHLPCSRLLSVPWHGSRRAWVVSTVPWRRTPWVIGVLRRGIDGEVVVAAYSV